MLYVEPELGKPAEAPVYHPEPRPIPRCRNSQNVLKHNITEVVAHSLQKVAQQFKKIIELKISKVKGGYLANTTLIFNSWLKDITYVSETVNWLSTKLCSWLKTIWQSMPMELSSFITTQMTSKVTLSWLNIWVWHLSQEKLSILSLVLYIWGARNQVLARKVISVCSKWRSHVNEALNTQLTHRLWDQYFVAMICNLLKLAPHDMTYAKFWAECISIFGTRSRKAVKTTVSTSVVRSEASKADQPAKSANQLCREKKKEKIKAQTKVIEGQKKEIENLKATSMQLDPQKMIEAMTQAMACLYNSQKGPNKKSSGTKTIEGYTLFRQDKTIWSG